jgi:ubiquinone/menaquinone biosynthesis C-methylase UbiE
MERGHGDVVRQVVAQLPFATGHRVLDLGCGNGWATRMMAGKARDVRAVGIDCAREMVARARRMTDAADPADRTSPCFVNGRFEALPFADAVFDQAFSMEAIYYAVELERALREIARVVRPNGRVDLVIDCFAESPSTRSWSAMVGLHMHCLPEAEWCRRLERAGLRNARSTRVIDSRGPGDEAAFVPSAHCPDWATQAGLHAAGSLWLSARGA